MNAEAKESLISAGVDLDRTLGRFMNNEAMYEKFLHKLANDQNFALLEKYLQENNSSEAERAAHTLKGVAANLGLDPLANYLDAIVAGLRDGQTCAQQKENLLRAGESYRFFCELIEKF